MRRSESQESPTCPPDRPSKILLVQVGTLSSSPIPLKKTHNPREGWEDGTPPPHRDFKERGVVR